MGIGDAVFFVLSLDPKTERKFDHFKPTKMLVLKKSPNYLITF